MMEHTMSHKEHMKICINEWRTCNERGETFSAHAYQYAIEMVDHTPMSAAMFAKNAIKEYTRQI